MLVRLLLENVVGLGMVLSGTVSLGDVIPSLVCSRAAPNPIPDASVSRYRGFCFIILHAYIIFISDFTSSYRACYDAFHVHNVLLNISFWSGSHVLAVLGGNLPK